jgi:hypothetical protein
MVNALGALCPGALQVKSQLSWQLRAYQHPTRQAAATDYRNRLLASSCLIVACVLCATDCKASYLYVYRPATGPRAGRWWWRLRLLAAAISAVTHCKSGLWAVVCCTIGCSWLIYTCHLQSLRHKPSWY